MRRYPILFALIPIMLTPLACLKPTPTVPLPVVKMSATELLSRWKKNPVEVTESSRGKMVELTGTVKDIDSNAHDQTYVRVIGDESKDYVMVFLMDKSLVAQMKDFPKGAAIKVRATFSEPVGDMPRMTASEIVP